jgi:hypothetical protein
MAKGERPAVDVQEAARLREEYDRLRQRVEQLEAERDQDRQLLTALRAEHEAYRRALYAWAADQITEEDLQRYAQEEEGVPLSDFIKELEELADGGRNA